mgnify:FL=1
MDLRQIFMKIFDKEAFKEARITEYNSDHPFFNLFSTEIPKSLQTIADGFQSKPTGLAQALYRSSNAYSFVGSIGKGNLADIFWFGILDRKITDDPQKGVYVVYLVSYDGKSIYLSLIQAVNGAIRTEPECEEAIRKLKAARGGLIEKIENRLSLAPENYAEGFTKGAIDLSIGEEKTFFTAKAYQEATLYSKKYSSDNVPSEEELRKDLRNMLKIYGQYRTSLKSVTQR